MIERCANLIGVRVYPEYLLFQHFRTRQTGHENSGEFYQLQLTVYYTKIAAVRRSSEALDTCRSIDTSATAVSDLFKGGIP